MFHNESTSISSGKRYRECFRPNIAVDVQSVPLLRAAGCWGYVAKRKSHVYDMHLEKTYGVTYRDQQSGENAVIKVECFSASPHTPSPYLKTAPQRDVNVIHKLPRQSFGVQIREISGTLPSTGTTYVRTEWMSDVEIATNADCLEFDRALLTSQVLTCQD